MKIIKPSHEILFIPEDDKILNIIETAGRTCYKSESKDKEARSRFIKGLVKSGHHSVIEHANITVRFICDRGVSHELVRHRLASYSQESTRYCNFSKNKFGNEITVIKPCFWEEDDSNYKHWFNAMQYAENSYLNMIQQGATAEQARSVLPNSLKTDIVMTANCREVRHILKLRCSKAAHPQIRELMEPLKAELKERLPDLFSDI